MPTPKKKQPKWMDALDAVEIEGRDGFYTHLMVQEIPFWLKDIREGGVVDMTDVCDIARMRGFNAKETKRFKALAVLLNSYADNIRRTETVETKVVRYAQGFSDGVRGDVAKKTPCRHYRRGYREGKRAKELGLLRFKASFKR